MSTALADATRVVPEQLGGVASRLLEQVSAMGDEALTERARELAGAISAAEANLAAVLAEVERRAIHQQWECRSIERFAGWHLQLSPSRTKALADVGRSMGELPVVAEAVADGTLSFDKATSVARVAAPDTEGALVELALHATVGQTRRICGQWRKVEQRESADPGTDGRSEARPTVMVFRDEDGIELTIRFDHVRGELGRPDGTEILANLNTDHAPVTDALHAPDLVAARRLELGGRPPRDRPPTPMARRSPPPRRLHRRHPLPPRRCAPPHHPTRAAPAPGPAHPPNRAA